jgi:hypothetical protein
MCFAQQSSLVTNVAFEKVGKSYLTIAVLAFSALLMDY